MPNQSWVQTFGAGQVDGPTLTAAAAASCIPTYSKISLPNTFFAIGAQLLVKMKGRISCVVTTPGTARFDLRLGGTVIWDSLAMPLNVVAKANVPWDLEVLLTCRAVGNAALTTFWGDGKWTSEAVLGSPLPSVGGSGTFVLPYNTAPAIGPNGIDGTSAQTFDSFFTQTVATGSLTVHSCFVQSLQ